MHSNLMEILHITKVHMVRGVHCTFSFLKNTWLILCKAHAHSSRRTRGKYCVCMYMSHTGIGSW